MIIHYSLEELSGIKNPVVTTGSFDGVHVGHKAIIRRLKKLARDNSGESVLITFHPHPRRVLYPDTEGKDLLMINTQREKICLLEKTGLDHLMIVDFTLEFSRISSHMILLKMFWSEFSRLTPLLLDSIISSVTAGKAILNIFTNWGISIIFTVEEIPEQDIQNESVSSTKIRQALTTREHSKSKCLPRPLLYY
jgi:riboflavin kinase / FMN adenylyltransferase